MQLVLDGGNISAVFYVMKVGTNGDFCNLVDIFVCEQGHSVIDNYILYEVFPQVPLVAVFVEVFLSIALIVGVPSSPVAIGVHLRTAMAAVQLAG